MAAHTITEEEHSQESSSSIFDEASKASVNLSEQSQKLNQMNHLRININKGGDEGPGQLTEMPSAEGQFKDFMINSDEEGAESSILEKEEEVVPVSEKKPAEEALKIYWRGYSERSDGVFALDIQAQQRRASTPVPLTTTVSTSRKLEKVNFNNPRTARRGSNAEVGLKLQLPEKGRLKED